MNTTITTNHNGLPALRLETKDFEAEILFQGAHVTSFKSKALNRELFWLSAHENYLAGNGIRGGVPICFPWFGPHSSNPHYPRHGFARNLTWQLLGEATNTGSGVSVSFLLVDSPVTHEFFPFKFSLQLEMIFTANGVSQLLRMKNMDDKSFECEALLHPYFAVKNLAEVAVSGLDGRKYFDKVKNTEGNIQEGPVEFHQNVDSVYLETGGRFVIHEHGIPTIEITQTTGRETVVWNPGGGKTKTGEPGIPPNFVCVEPGRVNSGKFRVEPGREELLGARFTLLE